MFDARSFNGARARRAVTVPSDVWRLHCRQWEARSLYLANEYDALTKSSACRRRY